MHRDEFQILFGEELIQKREEGCDVSAFENMRLAEFDEQALRALYDNLAALRPLDSFDYVEPSALDQILAEASEDALVAGPANFPDENVLLERLQGAWLGRAAGCLLGKPVEGWPRHHIENLLAKAGCTGLDNYFPEVEYTEGPFAYLPIVLPWLRGNIDKAASDDDMDYPILGLLVLEASGGGFSSEDVLKQWMNRIPYGRVFTAEYIAYRNYANGLKPPYTATTINPYREWIGAQIRADIWGYVNPHNPRRAAEFAHRDASLSHAKNGIYGEMYFAAVLALVLGGAAVREALEKALAVIPQRSRFAEMQQQVFAWCAQATDWRQVWDNVQERYGAYNRVHTINNAAYVILSLLLADGDYERAITTSVLCGLDTDCNGATVGSIMGASLGASKLPEKWVGPLHDTLESDLAGIATMKISDLAQRTLKMARTLQAAETK